MLKNQTPFHSYSVLGTETEDVLEAHFNILDEYQLGKYKKLYKTNKDFAIAHEYICLNTEDFQYTIASSSSDYNQFHVHLRQGGGANWLSLVCRHARDDGVKINLSGMGGG